MTTPVPTRFAADYAKRVAKCQKCKMQLEKGILRLAKIVPNFFVAAKDSSKPPPDMKQYFHVNCLFEMLFKARPTTKVIDDSEEIEGFEDLTAEDQGDVQALVDELTEKRSKDGPVEAKTPKKPKKKAEKEDGEEEDKKEEKKEAASSSKKRTSEVKSKRPKEFNEESEYNSFFKFVQVRGIIKDLEDEKEKSGLITTMLQKKKFDGDLLIWLTLLLPTEDSRQYNVSDEELVKYFSKILDTDEAKIQKYVTKSGDIALSIGHALDKKVKNEKSGWSIQKVDRFLAKLAEITAEELKLNHFKFAAKRMNHEELEVLIRLIRKENDTEADAKIILKGIHDMAPKCFEDTKSLDSVVDKYYNNSFETAAPKKRAAPPKSKKAGEPKAKKGKPDEDKYDSEDDVEESQPDLSDSEAESDIGSDSDTDGDEDISGSDSDDISEISSEEDESVKENSPKKKARGTKTRPREQNGQVVKTGQVEGPQCPPGMEACRYGEHCYRRNVEHREKFWHPQY